MSAKVSPGQFERWLQNRVNEQLGDAALLDRFCLHRDETAFAALVERHGPMVRAVCGRLLADSHDRDDAFQATFLVLAQKANSIRSRSSAAAWLHGVARRVALQARSRSGRFAELTFEPAAVGEDESRELKEWLDGEIDRLPEKYRLPLALCCLQGRTLEQAALQLGWPKGSVAGRLARAKGLLRARLARRGAAAASLAALDAAASSAAALPSGLGQRTVLAAQVMCGRLKEPQISSSALALAQGASNAMFWSRTLAVASCAVLLGVTLGGAAWLVASVEAKPPARTALPKPFGGGQAKKPNQPDSAAAIADAGAWRLLFAKGDARRAVSVDGKSILELKPTDHLQYDVGYVRTLGFASPESMPINGALSPDGTRLAFIGKLVDGKAKAHPWHGFVILSKPDGSQPTLLTPTEGARRSLSWSPDGKRLAFEEDKEQRLKLPNKQAGWPGGGDLLRCVNVLDAATGRVLYTFGGTNEIIHSPQFTPRGRLAYLVLRARDGKQNLDDLVVRILDGVMSPEALKPRTLVEKQFMLGFSFSPDEGRVAYSLGEDMVVLNLEEAGQLRYSMSTLGDVVGKPLNVCFMSPLWRADGKALACRCAFLGGRAAGPDGKFDEQPMPGEDLVVVFPADKTRLQAGEPLVFPLDRSWRLAGWLGAKEAGGLAK